MKKQLLTIRMLLVVAMLCLGVNVTWGQNWTTVQTLDFETEGTYNSGWSWADASRQGSPAWYTLSESSHAMIIRAGSSYTQDYYYTFTNTDFTSANEWKMELDLAFTSSNTATNQFFVYSAASGSSWGCFASTTKLFSLQNTSYSTDVKVFAGDEETTPAATLSTAATNYAKGGGPDPTIFIHLIITANSIDDYVMLAIEDAGGTSLLAATKVCDFVHPAGMSMRNGKGIGKVALDDVVFSIVSNTVLVPSAELTAVNGTSRTITMTQAQSADIYYYECEDENYDTDGLTPTQYTPPLSINETKYYAIYATNGSTNSNIVNCTFEAGADVSLAAPTVSLTSVTNNTLYLENPTFTINAPDNSSVLLRPSTETLSYTFTPDGGVESAPTVVTSGATYSPTEKGTLKVYAATTGYTTSTYSIPVSNFYSVEANCDYSTYTTDYATEQGWTANEDSKWGTTSYRVLTQFSDLNRLRIRNDNTIDYIVGYGFGRSGASYEYYGRYATKGNITSFIAYASISSEPSVCANVLATSGSGKAADVVSYTVSSNNILKELNYYTPAKTPEVSISEVGWATYCSPYNLDFSETGATVYTAARNTTTNNITLSEVSGGKVPANTGVILYKNGGGDINPAVIASANDIENNELVGIVEDTPVAYHPSDDVYNYIMEWDDKSNKPMFSKAAANGATLTANKAYLSTAYNVETGTARALAVASDAIETTGINNVQNSGIKAQGYYNLNGQRVSNPTKGLYIVNGRKVVVK